MKKITRNIICYLIILFMLVPQLAMAEPSPVWYSGNCYLSYAWLLRRWLYIFMDKIKLFIVFDFLTAILWGVLTNQLFGTLWYWVVGISLAALSEFWVRKVKELSAQKAVALGLLEFFPMLCLLVTRYLCWRYLWIWIINSISPRQNNKRKHL